MRFSTAALSGLGLMMATLVPAQVSAEAKIYPYHGANFCPAGLQPVSVGGVICCGSPNQHISYRQALAHPVKKHRHARKHRPVYSAKAHCPAGTKGCSHD
jgi:hypothetical protein